MDTNKYFNLFLIGIILIVAVSSCSLDKRVYTSGYHIEWNHFKNASKIETSYNYFKRKKNETSPALAIENFLPDNRNDSTGLEACLNSSLDKPVIITEKNRICLHTKKYSIIAETQNKATQIAKTNINKHDNL